MILLLLWTTNNIHDDIVVAQPFTHAFSRSPVAEKVSMTTTSGHEHRQIESTSERVDKRKLHI